MINFNVTGNRARALYLRKMILLMIGYEKKFARSIRRILRRQYKTSATHVEDGFFGGYEAAIDQERILLIERFTRNYRLIATEIVKLIDKAWNDVSKTYDERETKDLFDNFWDEMNWFIQTQVATKVQKVNSTTKSIIKKIIQKGMNEGLSNRDIAKMIRKVSNISNESRIMTIVRTETHTAANTAIDTATRKLNVRMNKEWLSAKDARVRIDHAIADGETVPINDVFMTTGEPMRYPGDPAGSAWNVVNCRCITLYHTVKNLRHALKSGAENLIPVKR